MRNNMIQNNTIHTIYNDICDQIQLPWLPELIIGPCPDLRNIGGTDGDVIIIDPQKILSELVIVTQKTIDDAISHVIAHELAHVALMHVGCNREGIIKRHGWRWMAVATWIYRTVGWRKPWMLIDDDDRETYRDGAGPLAILWPLERWLAGRLYRRLVKMPCCVMQVAEVASADGVNVISALTLLPVAVLAGIVASTYA